MGKKEQVPALAIFVQGSLWVWSATSRGRPIGADGGTSTLAVFHVWSPRVPAAPKNLFIHPPADLRLRATQSTVNNYQQNYVHATTIK